MQFSLKYNPISLGQKIPSKTVQLKDENDTTNVNRPPPPKCAAMVSYKEALQVIFND